MPWGLLAAEGTPVVDFNYRTRTGLTVQVAGVPVVRGSWFQYLIPGQANPAYSSLHSDQQIEKTADGNVRITFRSKDGRAFGSQVVSRTATGVRIDFMFDWTGQETARLNLAAGMLWTPAMKAGATVINGSNTLTLGPAPASDATPTLADQIQELACEGPMGTLKVLGSRPEWSLVDTRSSKKAWAKPGNVLMLASSDKEIAPNTPLKTSLTLDFQPKPRIERAATASLVATPLALAVSPPKDSLPVLPRPKQLTIEPNSYFLLENTSELDAPLGTEFAYAELKKALKFRWLDSLPELGSSANGNIILRIQDLGLPPEAFSLTVNSKSIVAIGQDPAGLRWAMLTLAQMSQAKDGKLAFPACMIRDWPSVRWRGVHVFGGPNVLSFHQQLAERVLLPLRYNKVIFECERTRWKCLPYLNDPLYSDPEQLRKTFDLYRSLNIEPIPLIQSLGHMEWMFTPGSDTSLAVNPQTPYTLDLRQDKAKAMLEQVWQEAAELLQPKTMHFGCDEIDIRGMSGQPELTSTLWESAMPVLQKIAEQSRATGIVWGDKALAPGQAIDAALGDNPVEAERRRKAIPKEFLIGDWHYKNDPRPERFRYSLDLWSSLGFESIAAGWFNLDNIRGLTEAAYKTNSGYLQTTWAGHQFDEAALLKEYKQFSAYVAAADYAWSGRTQSPSEIGYDPGEVFARMFYSEPSSLSAKEGTSLGTGAVFQISNVRFRALGEQGFASVLEPGRQNNPTELGLTVEGLEGDHLALALSCNHTATDLETVADVSVELASGSILSTKILYGVDVRSSDDRRSTIRTRRGPQGSVRVLDIPHGETVKRITVRSKNSYVGLKLLGVTSY